jgi:hypothetical protein
MTAVGTALLNPHPAVTDPADVLHLADVNRYPGHVMRSWLTATWMIAAATAAQAQTTSPRAVPGAKPKPVATVPIRPALQSPADTVTAMAQAERLAIQSDLAWAGEYNGAINGEVSERMVAAIKTFQKSNGAKQTGVLNPQERELLLAAARKLQDNVGWKVVTDMVTGARLGIPTKLVPQQASDASGSKWSSSTGTIQVQLARRKEAAPSTAKLAELEKKEPAGRRIDYSVVKPDFFVLSGMQGLKKFYVRGSFRDSEVRILTILYDQATEGTMEPVVIAMSSAFNAFPVGTVAAGPPPRKKVEYASGVVVSDDGAILTDRAAIDGCLSIVVAGYGNADKVAEDKGRDLALLRLYGARGLKPAALGSGAPKSAGDVIGIADPQSQSGGSAVSVVKAALTTSGGAGDLAVSPSPGTGFSGAGFFSDGKLLGIVQLKDVVATVASANGTAPMPQPSLLPIDSAREFLKANGVSGSVTATDAKDSIVRVICVRK